MPPINGDAMQVIERLTLSELTGVRTRIAALSFAAIDDARIRIASRTQVSQHRADSMNGLRNTFERIAAVAGGMRRRRFRIRAPIA